jgi:hypothetical protein
MEHSRQSGGVPPLELGGLFDPNQPMQSKKIGSVQAARPQAKAQA